MSFGQIGAVTTGISVTGTSKPIAIAGNATQCRVVNTSTTLSIYFTFGVTSPTVAIPAADGTGTACNVLPPMGAGVFDLPIGTLFAAAIGSGAGPTLVYFTPGKEMT